MHSEFGVCFSQCGQFHLPGFVEKSHSVNLQFPSSCHTFCKYFSVHSIDNFKILAACFWTLCSTSCSCKLFCYTKLYSVVFFCSIPCGIVAKRHFDHVNQFHGKTTCTACLILSDKTPIACPRLQHWQQWLCAIACVRTPTVCFSPQAGGHARSVSLCYHKNFTWTQ